MKTALISVSDKTGVTDLALRLNGLGFRIVSTGGTAAMLRDIGLPVTDVQDVTGFPECLGGRVKSLHPHVHAAILARRNVPEDMAFLEAHGIEPIDLVAINLYPFKETLMREDLTFELALENIDIGGPTLLRGAAKNHASVTVLSDPADYDAVLDAWEDTDGPDDAMRFRLARKAFEHCAAYDTMIARYFREQSVSFSPDDPGLFPDTVSFAMDKVKELPDVYGASAAALYRRPGSSYLSAADVEVIEGRDLVADDLVTADLALSVLAPYTLPAVCVIRGGQVVGAAYGTSIREAWDACYGVTAPELDGALIAFNMPLTADVAEELRQIEWDAILAAGYEADAEEAISGRDDAHLLIHPELMQKPTSEPITVKKSPIRPGSLDAKAHGLSPDPMYRRVPLRGADLLFEAEYPLFHLESFAILTERQMNRGDFHEMEAALALLRTVPGYAAVIWKDGRSLAVGDGARDAWEALMLAADRLPDPEAAKDAMLVLDQPLKDERVVEDAADLGIRIIIEPGDGDLYEEAMAEVANAEGLALCVTGSRMDRASGGSVR